MAGSRSLKLRRADTCVSCGAVLAAGTVAYWDAEAKTVTCLMCGSETTSMSEVRAPEDVPVVPREVDRGTAGASAWRRYERLHEQRERTVHERLGKLLGGLYLALSSEPQSTVAWAPRAPAANNSSASTWRSCRTTRQPGWIAGSSLGAKDARNYSGNRDNLGHARGEGYRAAMADEYTACAAALKPGGFLVVVTKNLRDGGALYDLAGITVELCLATGLLYWQHVIALHAAIRDSELVPRPPSGS